LRIEIGQAGERAWKENEISNASVIALVVATIRPHMTDRTIVEFPVTRGQSLLQRGISVGVVIQADAITDSSDWVEAMNLEGTLFLSDEFGPGIRQMLESNTSRS
jgi:hypothetical protein